MKVVKDKTLWQQLLFLLRPTRKSFKALMLEEIEKIELNIYLIWTYILLSLIRNLVLFKEKTKVLSSYQILKQWEKRQHLSNLTILLPSMFKSIIWSSTQLLCPL